jgi:hypothetical protein
MNQAALMAIVDGFNYWLEARAVKPASKAAEATPAIAEL